MARRAGVGDRVRFELLNYQDLPGLAAPGLRGPFDRIVSVGMFEHVGRRGQARYVTVLDALLAEGGVSVLHTITDQRDRPIDAWVDRHIFPGGHLPTVAGIEHALAAHGFWSIDRENLWQHYARTLGHWRAAHRRHRDQIVAMFDDEFYRSRDLWLAGSQAGFAHGSLGLAQFVLTKGKPAHWPLTRRDLYRTPTARAEPRSGGVLQHGG